MELMLEGARGQKQREGEKEDKERTRRGAEEEKVGREQEGKKELRSKVYGQLSVVVCDVFKVSLSVKGKHLGKRLVKLRLLKKKKPRNL